MKNTLEDRIEQLSTEERKLFALKVKQLLTEKAVQSKSEPSKRLVAYVTTNGNFDSNQLKRSLKAKVPDYMVPSRIVEVDRFPVLPNGKIDKKALSRIAFSQVEQSIIKVQLPTNAVEKELLSIWQEVLGLTAIGIHDNFFEIGGDSILSIQVIAKARLAGMPLSPNHLFECQSISELARFILLKKQESKDRQADIGLKHLVAIRSKGSKPPLFCLHSGGTHFFFYNLFATHLDTDRPVYALQASQHEGEITFHQSVAEMAEDFIVEIKKVQPHGPYHFVSYCFNTAIGVEITRILSKNSEPANLIIADTMADYLSLFAPSRTTKRAAAFLERLKANPVKTVSSLIKNKAIEPLRETLKTLTSTGSEKIIQKLHNNHIKIYSNYDWRPFESRIQLLLTPKKDADFNNRVVDSWKNLANKGVNIVPVEGHHDSLFLAPTVEKTAASIETCMRDFENC